MSKISSDSDITIFTQRSGLDLAPLLDRPVGSIKNILLTDHIFGFDQTYENIYLREINNHAEKNNIRYTVYISYWLTQDIRNLYKNLDFKYLPWTAWAEDLQNYRQHPELKFENFVCTLSASYHVSRSLLLSALDKFGWFTNRYITKGFVIDKDKLQGQIKFLSDQKDSVYLKTFSYDEKFLQTVNVVGNSIWSKSNPANNILQQIETKLTSSFVHVVAEGVAETYLPFVTEKFLYSVCTRGLFVAYAQPNWHATVNKILGFRLYHNLFDYTFDAIPNPVDRLFVLLGMLSKYQNLSNSDWHDLYQLEIDAIEYNYDHFFSKKWQSQISQLT